MSDWYVDEYDPGGYIREVGKPSQAAIVWCHDLAIAEQIVRDHNSALEAANDRARLLGELERLRAAIIAARASLPMGEPSATIVRTKHILEDAMSSVLDAAPAVASGASDAGDGSD